MTRSERVGAGAWAAAGVTTTGFDALGRVVSVATTSSTGGPLGSYHSAYDAADRMVSETVDGVIRSYAYDATGQLTADGGTAFAYDAAGNRVSGGGVVTAGNRLASDGTWAYSYDADGRVTTRSKAGEAWAYSYDHTGQLTLATKSATPGGAASTTLVYRSDVFGNLAERTETPAGGSSTTTRYAYDGWDTAKPESVGGEHFDAWADLDGSNTVTARRLHGAGFDEPLARLDPGGSVAAWYGVDGRGSVTRVFTTSGTVTGSRAYTAFGVVTTQSGPDLDRYAYTAREWDATLGLQHTRARVYDPAAGRFLSEDPIGFAAGDVNLHRYVGNQPTTRTDPSGLWPPCGRGGLGGLPKLDPVYPPLFSESQGGHGALGYDPYHRPSFPSTPPPDAGALKGGGITSFFDAVNRKHMDTAPPAKESLSYFGLAWVIVENLFIRSLDAAANIAFPNPQSGPLPVSPQWANPGRMLGYAAYPDERMWGGSP